MAEERSAGDPARTLELLWRDTATRSGGTRSAAPAGPDRRRGGRGRHRAGRRRGSGGGDHASGRPGAGRRADVAVHVRAGQGRAAGPDAGRGLRAGCRAPTLPAAGRGAGGSRRSPRRTGSCSSGTRGRRRSRRSRPPLGPGLMAKYEHELRAFEGLGLDDVEMDAALTYVLGFVQASARSAADAAAVQRDTRDERRAVVGGQRAACSARVFDERSVPDRGPGRRRRRAAHHGAYSPSHAYRFGLQRVLDGLGVLIERRAGRGGPARVELAALAHLAPQVAIDRPQYHGNGGCDPDHKPPASVGQHDTVDGMGGWLKIVGRRRRAGGVGRRGPRGGVSVPALDPGRPSDHGVRSDPPALVNLMAHRYAHAPLAADVTLLDLATGGTWTSVDLGTGSATVRLCGRPEADLAGYERRVLDQVAARSAGRMGRSPIWRGCTPTTGGAGAGGWT